MNHTFNASAKERTPYEKQNSGKNLKEEQR